jgi:hypothetical protein
VSLKDRIGAGQASKTVMARPVRTRTAASVPKRRRGRLDYEFWQIGLPLMDAAFGILRGPEDLAMLINLRGTGEPSKGSQQKIDEFLRQRASKAIMDLKRWLGLKRGRLRDVSKERVWALAATLREKDPKRYSWRSLAQKLDAEGYAKDPQLAMDRMRHGVDAVLERRREEKRNSRNSA